MKKSFFFILMAIVTLVGFACFFSGHEASGSTLAMAGLVGQMNRDQLEAIANEYLSDSYEGDDYEGYDDLDEMDTYDGFDDPMLSFLGASRSFLDEKKAGVYLQMRIVNNSGYSKVICLNPAFYSTLGFNTTSKYQTAGANVEYNLEHCNISEIVAAGNSEIGAVIADGIIYRNPSSDTLNITCAGVNGKIADHLNFTRRNAVRIPQITLGSVVTATGAIDTTIYSKIMTIRRVSPYHRIGGDVNIDLNEFFDVRQFQAGKIEIDTAKYGLQADDQTLFFMEIDNGLTVSVKFAIGAIANQAKNLHSKAQTAARNIVQGTAGKIPVAVRQAKNQAKKRQMNVLLKTAFGKRK